MASCFSCQKLISLSTETKVASMVAKFIAFVPPTNKSYKITEDGKSNERGNCYLKVNFEHFEFEDVNYPFIERDCYLLQKCSTRKKIVLIHIINTSINKNKPTIIFSHGNSCDIGVIYPFLMDMSIQFKADVISYDYSGYGCSEGTPSEKEIYSDIEQVMDFAIHGLGLKLESIILIGNSLGSVPTVHLAVHPIYSKINGIILISPIASGIKLFNPKVSIKMDDLEKIDVFCNLSKVENIRCPVFVIHGVQDEIIPHSQSLEMINKIKYVYDWFPNRGTHTNITTHYRSKFYAKIKLFIEHLKYFKKNESGSDSDVIEESVLDKKKISVDGNKKKLKNVKYEENYIKCEKKQQQYDNSSPVEITIAEDQNVSSYGNIQNKMSPPLKLMSGNRINIFDLQNCNDNYLVTQSVENEGEYIFANNRMSECYYNYKDAKELEHQFNLIQKNVMS